MTRFHFPNTVKLHTTNRVFFSFIVSGRLFREKWPAYLNNAIIKTKCQVFEFISEKKIRTIKNTHLVISQLQLIVILLQLSIKQSKT